MSAIQPPEPDIEDLESNVKVFLKYLRDTRKYEQQKRIETARAKVEAELDNARQLEAEASALTKKMRLYF